MNEYYINLKDRDVDGNGYDIDTLIKVTGEREITQEDLDKAKECVDNLWEVFPPDTDDCVRAVTQTLDNAYKAYPGIRGSIIHSDRGSQYTSDEYRKAIKKYGINQSMNSAGGRCKTKPSSIKCRGFSR